MTTFFVGGCMRTGTTLLQSVLCSTEKTNPLIKEAQYLSRIINLHQYGQETFEAYLDHYFSSRQELKSFHADLIQSFLERTLRRFPPAVHLVLKHPEMTPLFPELGELVGDAKFVVVARDPRDTIASILEVAEKQAKRGQTTNLTVMKGDVRKHCQHFNWYYAPLINSKDPGFQKRMKFVRYEDLVLRSAEVAAKLAEFTGLPLLDFDPTGQWRWIKSEKRSIETEKAASEEARNHPFYAELRGKPLSSEKIGRHAERLSQQEISTIERECEVFMGLCGYAPRP